jgi:bifunctional non-homologous end joining protein LigD
MVVRRPFERRERGPNFFAPPCQIGSKLSSQCAATVRYQGGRSKGWLKIKNRKHPAMERVLDAL